MCRFEAVPEQVDTLVSKIKDDMFPQLEGARIMCIFDNKKKKAGGKLVIARIKKFNDELKFLAMNDLGITYDYAIFIDHQVWDNLVDRDKNRIIFHELLHTDVNYGKDDPWKLRDHEIQGFYDEIDYNADDPQWAERLFSIAESVHDKE